MSNQITPAPKPNRAQRRKAKPIGPHGIRIEVNGGEIRMTRFGPLHLTDQSITFILGALWNQRMAKHSDSDRRKIMDDMGFPQVDPWEKPEHEVLREPEK